MKKITRFITYLAAVLAMAFALAACGGSDSNGGTIVTDATPSPSPVPQTTSDDSFTPLMWLVTAPNGQTMYIFGSIHVASADLYPLPPIVMDAFERSDYLATEVFEPDEAAFEVFVLTDGRLVTDFISEDLRDRALDALLDYIGYGADYMQLFALMPEVLDVFHPFMWVSIFQELAVELSSLSVDYGLETVMWEMAAERGMPVLAIEDVFAVNAALAALSPELLSILLESSLDITAAAAATDVLYGIWLTGDYYALMQVLMYEDDYISYYDAALSAEWTDALLTDRDILMADRASEFMAEGKKVFFVVGAAHLIGEGSVIDLLQQRGYQVERMR